MSKLKNKLKRNNHPNQLSLEALEQRAEIDNAQRNFRRAKEWLKELCKRNKEKYLPQLIDCYNGLARQMMEKGQMSEAKTVLDQIRQLSGDKGGIDPQAEVLLALQSGDFKKAAETLISHYGERDAPLSPEDGRSLADMMVIAFEGFPGLRDINPEIHEELSAVRRALECVCAGRFTDAVTELKAIKRQSIFAGWRIFVKGLCAFYDGEDSKALEAFQRLGNEGLLSKAAQPFIFIISGGTTVVSKGEPKEPLLVQVLRVLNRSDMEHVLPRAEYLWQLGRHADSYDHTARTLTGFPGEGNGTVGTLSRFYFNAPFHMDFGRAEKYLMGIHPIVNKKKDGINGHLLFARMRNLLLGDGREIRDRDLLVFWEEFLAAYKRVHGENPRITALVYAHLGNIFSREIEDEQDDPLHLFFKPGKRKAEVRNWKLAEEAYEKSLGLNNEDKDVHLGLLDLYEKTGMQSKRNKKLDEINRLFPDDKVVLVKNGKFCVERKAFIKGIDYLKKAVALDPLDRNNREALCVAYIKASLHFAQKGPAGRYREFMTNAMELGQPGTNNMTLGHQYLQVRHAVFEWIAGHEEEGNLIFEDALERNSDSGQLTYFAYLIGRTYRAPQARVSRLEKEVKAIFRNPLPGLAATFADIITYVELIALSKPWLYRELDLLNAYATKAADKACTVAEAERIVRYALDQEMKGEKLGRLYIRKVLKKDPRNPLFLYFEHIYKYDMQSPFRSPPRDKLQKLKDILAIAVERNERLLVDILNKRMREVETYVLNPPHDDWEDEEEEDERVWDYEAAGESDEDWDDPFINSEEI